MSDALLLHIGDWALYAAAATGVIVCVYYTLVAKWWKKPEGRLIFSWAGNYAILLLFLAVRVATWLSRQGSEWFRIVIYVSAIYLFLWLGRRISKAQSAPLQKGEINPSERVPLSLNDIEPRKRWRRK